MEEDLTTPSPERVSQNLTPGQEVLREIRARQAAGEVQAPEAAEISPCFSCKSPLVAEGNHYACPNCGRRYSAMAVMPSKPAVSGNTGGWSHRRMLGRPLREARRPNK